MSNYTAFENFASKIDLSNCKSLDEVVGFLINEINDEVDTNGFIDILIRGGQGMGKSTLALYIMYKYYGSSKEVLKNVFFRAEELRNTIIKEKRPVLLLDDAGITLSKWRFMSKEAIYYNLLQQLARKRAHAFIYTTVGSNIVRNIRENVDYSITLKKKKIIRDKNRRVIEKVIFGKILRYELDDDAVHKKLVAYFTMNLNELHNNPEFHELYVLYDKMRDIFVDSVFDKLFAEEEEERSMEALEKLYTVKEAAELLGVKIVTIRKWIREKRLKAVLVNNLVRIPKSEIEKTIRIIR